MAVARPATAGTEHDMASGGRSPGAARQWPAQIGRDAGHDADPAVFAREAERIFRRSWILPGSAAAHSGDTAGRRVPDACGRPRESGDYRVLFKDGWSGDWDSNLGWRSQSPLSYR